MLRAIVGRLRDSRGQAITELALLTPLAMLLALGSYDVSIFISDKVIAVSSARHGVRLASELGGIGVTSPASAKANCRGTLASATTLSSIDTQIVKNVTSVAATLNYAAIDEVDIYRPSGTDGQYIAGTDHVNKYKADGTAIVGSWTAYPLSERCQAPQGSEAEIGVRVLWHFTAPDAIPTKATINIVEYAVEKENLCTTNCT